MAVLKQAPGTHAELMREMRSPNGFDPMPPSQHEFLIDASEPATNRAIAWVWSKTIRPGRGHRRSPYAVDERGALRHRHAAIDLGWTTSNTRTVFERLAAQGRIRTENGKIWLCGDVPEPQRTKSETAKKKLCTYSLEPHFDQYLQALDENERLQRLKQFSEIQTYKRKLAAEALASARALGETLEQNWQRQIGYDPQQHKKRGRPKLTRPEFLHLSLTIAPDFVQNSRSQFVQNQPATSAQNENGTVRNSHPYVTEDQSLTELASVRPSELENEIRAIFARARLHEIGGRSLSDKTVSNIRQHVEPLSDDAIRQVFEVMQDKARQLAQRPQDANNKTWGWVVGLVRSEVQQRTAMTDATGDQLLATIRSTAAAKGMR